MFHHVARTRQGLLFRNNQQARQLWKTVLRACPGLTAACLMPNHIHLQHPRDLRATLGRALGGYVRWYNHNQGLKGPLLHPLPEPVWAKGPLKVRRDMRYIHLNPCRAGLCADPLAWAWSTHRDRVGLSLNPVLRADRQPQQTHRYVSGDPSTAVDGTPWPMGRAEPSIWDIQGAVSELTRTPMAQMQQRSAARSLWVHSLKAFGHPPSLVQHHTGLSRRSYARAPSASNRAVQLVAQLAGDPRFPGLS